MSIRFVAPTYDGGRILALTGNVEIGAVFPCKDGSAQWAFWLGQRVSTHVKAKSAFEAKAALMARFNDWLRFANLTADQPAGEA